MPSWNYSFVAQIQKEFAYTFYMGNTYEIQKCNIAWSIILIMFLETPRSINLPYWVSIAHFSSRGNKKWSHEQYRLWPCVNILYVHMLAVYASRTALMYQQSVHMIPISRITFQKMFRYKMTWSYDLRDIYLFYSIRMHIDTNCCYCVGVGNQYDH